MERRPTFVLVAVALLAAGITPHLAAQSCTSLQTCTSVGVGTTTPNPNAKLDVAGAIRLFGMSYPTTDDAAWFINESGVGLAVQSAGSLRLKTGGTTDRLTIDSVGNIGIGEAPAAGAKLDVNGPLRLPGSSYPTTDSAAWIVNESGVGLAVQSGGSLRLRTGGTTTDQLTVTTAGNVGVGNPPFGIGYPIDVRHYLRIASSPNDATSEAAGLLLSNRGVGTTNGEYAWHIVTGSPNQTSGIWANGLEMWEYPNPGKSYGCCLARVIIKKASDTTQPQPFVIDGLGNVGIAMTPDPQYALDVNGKIHATQVIGATYQDVAEWVPSTTKMSAGTVVIVQRGSKNTVAPSVSAYATSVAGVVSAQPGLILGEGSDSKEMIATTGRVKVHVDATRGAIEAGDLLVTSDKPGVAMKSQPVDLGGVKIHRPGTLIGKALEALPAGEGDILVLLSLQ